jgi:hypothetical protein
MVRQKCQGRNGKVEMVRQEWQTKNITECLKNQHHTPKDKQFKILKK